jgi:hypothetical protein
VLGFDLGFATVIGRNKSLLRSLMLRCLVSWCLMIRILIPWSLMLGQRSSAMICLSGHFFLGLGLLYFKEGALASDMPTQTVVMAYRRSSDGKRLLSAWNIIINLVLPFIFINGGRLWNYSFDKYNLVSRGSVSGRSYIPETSLVGWALLNG